MRVSLLVAACVSLVCSVRAADVELWWNISYALANPDQAYERKVVGINGTWPPPLVEVNQGDRLIIHAYNGLPDSGATLHVHGMYFNTTSYYDGAAFVTQCPIPSGQSLTYEIDTTTQWGTYWIHSHYVGQYVDGLRTPFIIHPPKEVQTYDDEYTIIVSDWYHAQHIDLMSKFMSKFNPTGGEPVPDSGLVYIAHNGTYHSMSDIASGAAVSAQSNVNAMINFEPGKTYRLRFLNIGAFAMFRAWIAGHNMTVIEMDGTDVEPFELEVLPLSVAQRFSVLVKARNDTTSNWPISVNMDAVMLDFLPDDLVLNLTAPIIYSESAPLEAPVEFGEYPIFWDTDLVPVEIQAMAPADVNFDMSINFATFDDGTNRATLMNNSTYVGPYVPTLFSELSMGQGAYLPQVYGAQTNALVLNHMDNIQITLFNSDVNSHPFHLHGHKFQVVQISQDPTSNDTSINPALVENQANPIRRDTVTVPGSGLVTLRFRADNPGVWFFHCHIEWHLESGLAVTFVEAPEQAQATVKPPQVMFDQCKAQGYPYSGNVVGLNSTTDFTGQPWGPFNQWHLLGWTPRAKGALAGTILAALAGVAAVIWYAMDAFKDEEREELAREEYEEKRRKGGKLGIVKKLAQRRKK